MTSGAAFSTSGAAFLAGAAFFLVAATAAVFLTKGGAAFFLVAALTDAAGMATGSLAGAVVRLEERVVRTMVMMGRWKVRVEGSSIWNDGCEVSCCE